MNKLIYLIHAIFTIILVSQALNEGNLIAILTIYIIGSLLLILAFKYSNSKF